MEDFAAKIAAISDHGLDLEDECEFHGYNRSALTTRNIEEEGKEGKEEGEEEDGHYTEWRC